MNLIKNSLVICVVIAAFSCSSDTFDDQTFENNQKKIELRGNEYKAYFDPCKALALNDFPFSAQTATEDINRVANYLNQLFNVDDEGNYTIHPCIDEMLGLLSPTRHCDEIVPIETSSGIVINYFELLSQSGTTYDGSYIDEAHAYDGLSGKELLFFLSQALNESEGIFGESGVFGQDQAIALDNQCPGGNVIISNINFVPTEPDFPIPNIFIEIEYSCCTNYLPPFIGQDTMR